MKRGATNGLLLTTCSLVVLLSSCGGERGPSTRVSLPPPRREARPVTTPTPGPAPTLTLQANPSTVERGQQTTLSWTSENTTSLVIDGGVGNVEQSGSVVITPRESTTFTATGRGPGGEIKASTRVTVVTPKEVLGIVSSDVEGLQRAINDGRVKDVFFDYDRAELTAESKATLEQDARWLRQFPSAVVVLEGHCDERGTEEYNLALGDRRAQATKEYLVELGVAPEQLEPISLGEERPFALGHDEAAFAQNRRAHFALKR
jgi:peptidoglycan-associated lipoprotein